MKKYRPLLLLIITVGILASPSTGFCQTQCSLLQVNNAATIAHASNMSYWFGVMELPMTWGLSGLGFWSIYKASKGA